MSYSNGMFVVYLPAEKVLWSADITVVNPNPTQLATLKAVHAATGRRDYTTFVPAHPPNPDRPLTKMDVAAAERLERCSLRLSQSLPVHVCAVVIDPEDAFTGVRRRLFALAYRMVGSRADAEDLVQEAYVRWHQAERATIDNPEAWLVTTATRLAIDRLRRLKTEREAYVGAWLPEPLAVQPTPPPDHHLE